MLVKGQRKQWKTVGNSLGEILDDCEEQVERAAAVIAASRAQQPGVAGGPKGAMSMHEADFRSVLDASSQSSPVVGLGRSPAGNGPLPPPKPSREGLDFVERLLICNENYRLGGRGIKEVMEHPWFNDIDWKALRARVVTPPWVPPSSEQVFLAGFQSASVPQLPHRAPGVLHKARSHHIIPADWRRGDQPSGLAAAAR